ncbi:hypothetical protein TNCV_2186131 [Trichonephila clavipes]|nr:hypothetical protein TNCV_2186131 [Trichonephila clavipes]
MWQQRDNPADFVSRGMDSLKLKTCELWWNGPKFLMSNQYPQRQIPVAVIKDPDRITPSISTRELLKYCRILSSDISPTAMKQETSALHLKAEPQMKYEKSQPFVFAIVHRTVDMNIRNVRQSRMNHSSAYNTTMLETPWTELA